MKTLLAAVLIVAVSHIASGQTYKARFRETVRAVATPPPHVTQRGVEGAIPRAQRGGNPLQMLNPLAPPQYGTAAQSVMLEPYTGKWNGIKLFEIFELRFYGDSGQSVETWPTATSGPDVPRAMEVTLAVKGLGRFKRLFLVNQ